MTGQTTGEMLAVVASLSRRNFYKSMTSYADHRVWHDVYHAPTPVKKDAYIKIALRGTAPVIQFKEKYYGEEVRPMRKSKSHAPVQ